MTTDKLTGALAVIEKMFKWLKILFCSHVFDPLDMQFRDENGIVRWPCMKCGTLFSADCGLTILHHGRCTGNWGNRREKKNGDMLGM